MKRTVTAFALAASMSAFAAPAAFAMGEELTMLELAVDRVFSQVGIEYDVSTLTVAELAIIKNIVTEDGASNAEKKRRIEAIIANN